MHLRLTEKAKDELHIYSAHLHPHQFTFCLCMYVYVQPIKISVLSLEQKRSRLMEGSQMSNESWFQAVGPETPKLRLS